MTFESKYLPLDDALELVAERTSTITGTNPLFLALEEDVLLAERRVGVNWRPLTLGEWKGIRIHQPRPYQLSQPGPNEVLRKDLRFKRADLDEHWPSNASQPLVRNKGGRPGKWDWEGAAIEMARCAILDDDAMPDQPSLKRLVAQWFVNSTGEQPSDSDLREHVKRFHQAIWPPKT